MTRQSADHTARKASATDHTARRGSAADRAAREPGAEDPTAPDRAPGGCAALDHTTPDRTRPNRGSPGVCGGVGVDHGCVLVVRLDDAGDVLLAGPAVRAVRARAREVVFLAGPKGRAAAELLPGVDRVVTWHAPWIDHAPPPVTEAGVAQLIDQLGGVDEAVVLTSFHQSALPLALLLRLAGVARIAAISNDYPGSLLDVRHVVDESADVPEAERMLGVAEAAGFGLPEEDDGKLAVKRPLPDIGEFLGNSLNVGDVAGSGAYVVVHPGTSAPARAWPAGSHRQTVRELAGDGHQVVVTGTERDLTAFVAGDVAVDLGGETTFAELAAVIERAGVLVAGNTGPAHLAAAVGTPVVSLFSPVVPAERWAPYGVPTVLLGDQRASCRRSRARLCPVPGHPCLSQVTSEQVVKAVRELTQ